MFGNKKRIKELELQFEQYNYDQTNLPPYKVEQALSCVLINKNNSLIKFKVPIYLGANSARTLKSSSKALLIDCCFSE